jgi:chromosomal replication initiator protein
MSHAEGLVRATTGPRGTENGTQGRKQTEAIDARNEGSSREVSLIGVAAPSTTPRSVPDRPGDAGPRRAEKIPRPAGPELLGRINDRLARRVGPASYSQYFEGQVSIRFSDGRLEVDAPTRFMAGLLGRRFGDVLREVTREETGAAEIEVSIGVTEAEPGPYAGQPASHNEQGHPDDDLVTDGPAASAWTRRPAKLSPASGGGPPVSRRPSRYRLDDFVVGESNRLAYDAATHIAEGAGLLGGLPGTRGDRSCSPLFIHGRCGMGKTHLLQGIAARFLDRFPGSQVRCTTGEAFTNEFIFAVREGSTGGTGGGKGLERFRKAYRRVDLLCIDDVHFLASKQATQGELLHTFDALDLAGARIVLASDEHPRHVKQFSEALVSRFMSGMVARLDPPDREMCERIVRRFAQMRGLAIEDAAVRAIALHACALPVGAAPGRNNGAAGEPARVQGGRCGMSIREIEGLLTRIEALCRLVPDRATGTFGAAADNGPGCRRVGMLIVQRALGIGGASVTGATGDPDPDGIMLGLNGSRPHRPVRLDMIIAQTCQMLRVDLNDLVGRGRHPRVVLARSMIAVLARRLTTLSYPEIARGMGRPNHSTIVTAFQRLQARIDAGLPAGLDSAPDMTLGEFCDRLTGVVLHAASRA